MFVFMNPPYRYARKIWGKRTDVVRCIRCDSRLHPKSKMCIQCNRKWYVRWGEPDDNYFNIPFHGSKEIGLHILDNDLERNTAGNGGAKIEYKQFFHIQCVRCYTLLTIWKQQTICRCGTIYVLKEGQIPLLDVTDELESANVQESEREITGDNRVPSRSRAGFIPNYAVARGQGN